jgi:hypothetical protein
MIRFGGSIAKEYEILTNTTRKAGDMGIAYYHPDFTKIRVGVLHNVGLVLLLPRRNWNGIK